MSYWQAGIVACGLVVDAAFGAVAPELPAWNEPDRAASVAGDGLLTGGTRPADGEQLDMAPPSAEEIAATTGATDEIPEKYWQAYFGSRPQTLLLDPQKLLSSADFNARLEFLQNHATDSAIDLFVYIYKGTQEIPGEVREEEVAERFFSDGRPAVIVYYYMGAPRRSMMYLSPSLTTAVSAAEQSRALDGAIMQALEKADAAGQLEAFLVQMSIRIYWMERLLGGGKAVVATKPLAAVTATASGKHSVMLAKLQLLIGSGQQYILPAAVAAGTLVMFMGIMWWRRRRASYRFPELTVEPRLGGAHAAGVGAVISFASAAVSPASQRDQVPEYLRRA